MTDALRCDHGVLLGEYCDACEDAQLSLVDLAELDLAANERSRLAPPRPAAAIDRTFETRPSPDPKQALLDGYLRGTRGVEVVTDPLGRVA